MRVAVYKYACMYELCKHGYMCECMYINKHIYIYIYIYIYILEYIQGIYTYTIIMKCAKPA